MGDLYPDLGEDALLLEGAGDERLELHHLPRVVVHPPFRLPLSLSLSENEGRRRRSRRRERERERGALRLRPVFDRQVGPLSQSHLLGRGSLGFIPASTFIFLFFSIVFILVSHER